MDPLKLYRSCALPPFLGPWLAVLTRSLLPHESSIALGVFELALYGVRDLDWRMIAVSGFVWLASAALAMLIDTVVLVALMVVSWGAWWQVSVQKGPRAAAVSVLWGPYGEVRMRLEGPPVVRKGTGPQVIMLHDALPCWGPESWVGLVDACSCAAYAPRIDYAHDSAKETRRILVDFWNDFDKTSKEPVVIVCRGRALNLAKRISTRKAIKGRVRKIVYVPARPQEQAARFLYWFVYVLTGSAAWAGAMKTSETVQSECPIETIIRTAGPEDLARAVLANVEEKSDPSL